MSVPMEAHIPTRRSSVRALRAGDVLVRYGRRRYVYLSTGENQRHPTDPIGGHRGIAVRVSDEEGNISILTYEHLDEVVDLAVEDVVLFPFEHYHHIILTLLLGEFFFESGEFFFNIIKTHTSIFVPRNHIIEFS